MVLRLTLLLVFLVLVVCEDDINLDNVGRFMSQSPEDLAKTLQLLENPYIAAALVNGDKTHHEKPPVTNNYPMEESNNLLNFLLSQRVGDETGTKYKVENPQFPLIPPVVDAKGIEKDPLLGSFFQDTMEDQPPLEVSEIMLIYGDLFIMCGCGCLNKRLSAVFIVVKVYRLRR